MSFVNRKGSINSHKPRRNPFNGLGSYPPYDDLSGQGSSYPDDEYGTTVIPKSMGRRQSEAQTLEPRLVGYSVSDSVYLKPRKDPIPLKIWLVLPYCFLYMAAFSMAFSTLVQYTFNRFKKELYPDVDTFNGSLHCDANSSEPDYKKQIHIQTETSNWVMYFQLASGVPAMFASVILGSSSDKFGRKFLFYLPCVGAIVRLTVCLLGIYFNFKLEYFLIGFAFDGITGYIASVLLVTFAYIADITPPKGRRRSFAIILVELSNGIATTVISFATGYFIHYTGYFYPMLTAALLVLLSFLIAFLIPETFPKEKRIVNETTLDKVTAIGNLYFTSENKGRRWMYIILSFIFILSAFTFFGMQNIEPIYQMDEPFCWGSEKIGYFGALSGFLKQVLGLGIFKLLQKSMTDEAVAMLGSFSMAASAILEGNASSDWMLYLVPAVGLCGLLTIPVCRSLLSKLTKPENQGGLFAAIAMLETAMSIVSSIGSNEIYIRTIKYYRGFAFFVFAGISFITFKLMGIYRFGSRRTYPIPLDIRA
ncbi:hypothetical protein ACF0H5_016560 [Mactra antiquata]